MSKTHALPLTRVAMRLLLLAPLKQAVVQRCGRRLPPIHSLITLGGQHQGVANTPGCSVDLTGAAAKACTAMQLLLARGAYAPWVRENIVQAQYFKVRAAAVIKKLCARHVKYVPGIQRNSRKHMVQAQYLRCGHFRLPLLLLRGCVCMHLLLPKQVIQAQRLYAAELSTVVQWGGCGTLCMYAMYDCQQRVPSVALLLAGPAAD